ncbi:MAG: porin [Candidatus Binatia bacterium]
MQSAAALVFVERGLPSGLVPNRDNGVQLFGDLFDGTFSYQLAVVNGVPDNVNPTTAELNDEKDFAGRVFAQPFKATELGAIRGLGIGIAGGYGRQDGSTSSPDVPVYRSFGQATFFSFNAADAPDPENPDEKPAGPVLANGLRTRVMPQAYYYYGPFGALFEYVHGSQEYSRNATKETVDTEAWQIAASYVLTGEPSSYRGVTPLRAVGPGEGGWGLGAWELTGRYSELDVDSDVFDAGFANRTKSAHRAEEFVVGTNWYLNKNVKFVLNYGETRFDGGAKTGDRPKERALLTRAQLVF